MSKDLYVQLADKMREVYSIDDLDTLTVTKVICLIFDLYKREILFQDKFKYLNNLAYNTFMIMISRNIKDDQILTAEAVNDAIRKSIEETEIIMSAIEEAGNEMKDAKQRKAYYNLMNNNHLSIMLQYSHIHDYILKDLKDAVNAYNPTFLSQLTPQEAEEALLKCSILSKTTRLQKVLNILIKHGGNLSGNNDNGEVIANFSSLHLTSDEIYSLQLFLSTGYDNLFYPIQTMEKSIFVLEHAYEEFSFFKPVFSALFFFLSKDCQIITREYPYKAGLIASLQLLQMCDRDIPIEKINTWYANFNGINENARGIFFENTIPNYVRTVQKQLSLVHRPVIKFFTYKKLLPHELYVLCKQKKIALYNTPPSEALNTIDDYLEACSNITENDVVYQEITPNQSTSWSGIIVLTIFFILVISFLAIFLLHCDSLKKVYVNYIIV
ncbi:uncharacterized protein NEPG_01651 [Nematocida parisii ERTm1]|uniref:uncharacterized protein n=1 Tax=Nematocida parisii (strain ERTm1 / ATCC PRA-289) TaxID=881290 RepID=UPI000264B30D|nr:uncharacterized protein NEPG_01651 [Nematocida parisii ERTm1]EIJ93309.1 hypothetical protein NEPG_01651 [Nematocida parisii ERTm1]|eukprot:XP_013059479.1 hypothetical protein NEPG_01651 [Nematocida parisii ERTm1]